VLYALREPTAFVALVVGFLVGVLVRGLVQAWTARLLGVRSFEFRRRQKPDLRLHGDPFGAIGAALGGLGWGSAAPIEEIDARAKYGRTRGRSLWRIGAVLGSGPLAVAVLGTGLLFAGRATGAEPLFIRGFSTTTYLHGSTGLDLYDTLPRMLLCAGVALLGVAFLALAPVPPLDGGRFLFAVGPATPGWQRARYWGEQNWGVAVLLGLLLIPISSDGSLLLVLFDAAVGPLLDLVGR
jgi:hypothetical protein